MESDEFVTGFRALEEAMWTVETRGNPEWFDRMLAPNFIEFGKSGRTFDRETIQQLQMPDEIDIELPFPNFAVRALEPTVVLVTYTSVQYGKAANRASLWRHDGTDWRLEFHMGTPQDPITAADLANPKFEVARRGYDCGDVDAFIAGLAART